MLSVLLLLDTKRCWHILLPTLLTDIYNIELSPNLESKKVFQNLSLCLSVSKQSIPTRSEVCVETRELVLYWDKK